MGDGLEPDRLPDAGDAGVEAPVRLEPRRLLAAGLQPGADVVEAVEHHFDGVAGASPRGQVDVDAGGPAPVLAGERPLDEDAGAVVGGADAQDRRGVVPIVGDAYAAPVPDAGDEAALADARSAALGGERHEDRAVEVGARRVGRSGVAGIDGEVPGAVEVDPTFRGGVGGAGVRGGGRPRDRSDPWHAGERAGRRPCGRRPWPAQSRRSWTATSASESASSIGLSVSQMACSSRLSTSCTAS